MGLPPRMIEGKWEDPKHPEVPRRITLFMRTSQSNEGESKRKLAVRIRGKDSKDAGEKEFEVIGELLTGDGEGKAVEQMENVDEWEYGERWCQFDFSVKAPQLTEPLKAQLVKIDGGKKFVLKFEKDGNEWKKLE